MATRAKRRSPSLSSWEKAKAAFRRNGGILRTRDALRLGVHPRTLYEMRDAGQLVRLERGVHRLSDLPPLGQPDLVTVSCKIPNGVTCLISALSYHGITTQVPGEVYVALARGAERPRLAHPPIRVFWFTGEAFSRGIEEHEVDGVTVRIYGPEKTLADCFKYRNKLGLDTFLEALRMYLRKKKAKPSRILEYARVCRVEKKMRPYLEGLL